MPSPKTWTKQELRLHKKAVKKLENIIKQATLIIKKGRITEEELTKIIIKKMAQAGLTSSDQWVIVAYGSSAADPHYQFNPGKSKTIKPGKLLLIDIWGKINQPRAPYADITHMYFIGTNPPQSFQKLWYDLREARDKAIKRIEQSCGMHGSALDKIARKHLDKCGYKNMFIHSLGHDLGSNHPHGDGLGLSPKSHYPLAPGRGYAIEPGIYKKQKYGLRTEINFFFTKNHKVQITTKIQKTLVCLA